MRARGRIAAGVRQPRDQGGPLDPFGVEPPGSRVVADEFGVGLEMGQRLDLGALAADGRSGAADGQDDDEAKDDYRQAGYRYG